MLKIVLLYFTYVKVHLFMKCIENKVISDPYMYCKTNVIGKAIIIMLISENADNVIRLHKLSPAIHSFKHYWCI